MAMSDQLRVMQAMAEAVAAGLRQAGHAALEGRLSMAAAVAAQRVAPEQAQRLAVHQYLAALAVLERWGMLQMGQLLVVAAAEAQQTLRLATRAAMARAVNSGYGGLHNESARY